MRQVHLMAPVIQGQTVTFQWRVEPESALYRQTRFTISFPSFIDLSRVPAVCGGFVSHLPASALAASAALRSPSSVAARRPVAAVLAAIAAERRRQAGRLRPFTIATPLDISIVGGDLDVPCEVVTGRAAAPRSAGARTACSRRGCFWN